MPELPFRCLANSSLSDRAAAMLYARNLALLESLGSRAVRSSTAPFAAILPALPHLYALILSTRPFAFCRPSKVDFSDGTGLCAGVGDCSRFSGRKCVLAFDGYVGRCRPVGLNGIADCM